MQDFKHMHAWQRAHALSIALHKRARDFSRLGYGNLRAQLTRTADSIATNIVEGCGASTKGGVNRLLDIAIKSANETEHHILSARGLDLMSAEDSHKYTAEVIEIRKMMNVYRRRIIESNPRAQMPRIAWCMATTARASDLKSVALSTRAGLVFFLGSEISDSALSKLVSRSWSGCHLARE